ncbi:MAG: hypothetical protein U0793_12740 [Gemmataceae bacterium]
MARRTRKATDTQTGKTSEATDAIIRQPAETPPGDAYEPAGSSTATEQFPPQERESEGRKFVELLPHHVTDLGDGRRLTLTRDRRFQQERIQFVALSDDVDPRPSVDDVEFLKQHGYKWRSESRAWVRQLAKSTEENRTARGDSDKAAEDAYAKLANRIRERNGLPATQYSLSEERQR